MYPLRPCPREDTPACIPQQGLVPWPKEKGAATCWGEQHQGLKQSPGPGLHLSADLILLLQSTPAASLNWHSPLSGT